MTEEELLEGYRAAGRQMAEIMTDTAVRAYTGQTIRGMSPYDPAHPADNTYLVVPHDHDISPYDLAWAASQYQCTPEEAVVYAWLRCYRYSRWRSIRVEGREIKLCVPTCVAHRAASLRAICEAVEPVLHRRILREDELDALLRHRAVWRDYPLTVCSLEMDEGRSLAAIKGGGGRRYYILRDIVRLLRKYRAVCPGCRRLRFRAHFRFSRYGGNSEWLTIRGPAYISDRGIPFCTEDCYTRMLRREDNERNRKALARLAQAEQRRQRCALREGAKTLNEIRTMLKGGA